LVASNTAYVSAIVDPSPLLAVKSPATNSLIVATPAEASLRGMRVIACVSSFTIDSSVTTMRFPRLAGV